MTSRQALVFIPRFETQDVTVVHGRTLTPLLRVLLFSLLLAVLSFSRLPRGVCSQLHDLMMDDRD